MKRHGLTIPVLLLWAALTAAAWLSPAKERSLSERRPLAQRPALSVQALENGSFMKDFEKYTLDQFPLREEFRRLKAVFHRDCLGQRDNNGIYLSQGYAAKQEYPYQPQAVSHALKRFQWIYENYLTDSRVFLAAVPDKGFYLAAESGQLGMDYEALFDQLRQGAPWAVYVDLTDTLSLEDYYRTDTHWRQEKLLPTADRLCQALGVASPKAEDYTVTLVERPFYGVYYGQAALPMEPESLYLMESDLLAGCRVFDYETGKTGDVYDRSKLDSPDLYDVYLSGARALLTIENPAADSERELIVFRDSFGSSLTPLLVQGYARVTLVDIRYLQPELLGQLLDFHGQDVLFLYSTLVLNSAGAIK